MRRTEHWNQKMSAEITQAVAMIRSFNAFAVVGAGLSAGGYPMTAQLPPLLWQAIEDIPEALIALRERTGIAGSAKEVLASDQSALEQGWRLVRAFPPVRAAFQAAFAALDADRDPSSAHFDLARLVNSGHIEGVVSFNWDTCVERAYEHMYGVSLPTGVLHKPHGDAAHPEDDWILPDEDGMVSSEVLDHVVALSDRPRTLLVLGYSGSDAAVVESLLAPLEERWPVVRVGPSATGEGAIRSTADTALSAVASQLVPPDPLAGWKHVTFARSRSFLAALRGERLRPTDVNACPELPAAPRLAERLLASRFATLSGSSGTGKSVTAFHAARRLNRDGWKVVELKQAGVATPADVAELTRLRGPVLAVVDDAQAIDRNVIAAFESSVDDDHAVLLVSTEQLEPRDGETLLASQAVATLHAYCRANLNTIGPLLTELDDRVRWSAFSDTPEQRLELAARTATEPWLYMFVASGGERRIGGTLDRAVENIDAALVFAFVCVGQMTSRDAGVARGELDSTAMNVGGGYFSADGVLDTGRIDRALLFLSNSRLVREQDDRIRASHIRIAERALQNLGCRDESGIGAIVRECVRTALLDVRVDAAGKFWLLRVFDRIDTYRYEWASALVDEEVSEALVNQCLRASPGNDRGVALNLVWTSEWFRKLSDETAEKLADGIMDWLPSMTSEEANGYRWMLSGLRSSHEAAYERIRNSVAASVIAERVSVAGSRQTAIDWTQVIQELCTDWRTGDLLAWSDEFEHGIDAEALKTWVSMRDSRSHPFEIYDFVDALASIAPQTAAIVFDVCADEIREAMESDLADAASNFSDWVFGTMLMVASLADAPSASDADEKDAEDEPHESDGVRTAFMEAKEPALRELADAVLLAMQKVDWEKATKSLESKKKYQLHNLDMLLGWLSYLSTDITDEIATNLSTDWLLKVVDEASQEGWPEGRPFGAIDHLLHHLSFGDRGASVIRGFLMENESKIEPFPSTLVKLYPDLAVHWLKQGRLVEVHAPRGSGWGRVFNDLEAVALVDRDAAVSWLAQMPSSLLAALNQPQKHDLVDAGRFISLADSLDPSVLDTVIAQLDSQGTQESWSARWEDARDALRPVLHRVSRVTCGAANGARALLRNDDVLALRTVQIGAIDADE